MKDKNKIGFGIIIGSLLCMLILIVMGNKDAALCIIPLIIGGLMCNLKQ